MPVTGANKVKSNLHQLFNNIATNKVMQFGNAVMANAASLSKEKAPIEFGTLVNSQRIDVTKQAGRVIFSLGYYTSYAAALNNPQNRKSGVLASSRNTAPKPYSMSGFGSANIFNTNLITKSAATLSPSGTNGTWKPRPPVLKKGNAWNPDATPHFLEYGFESSEAVKNTERLAQIFKV